MNLAFGIIFLWLGSALLFLASRGLDATNPWSAFQTVLTRMEDSADGNAA